MKFHQIFIGKRNGFRACGNTQRCEKSGIRNGFGHVPQSRWDTPRQKEWKYTAILK